jgi:hypothetical protein
MPPHRVRVPRAVALCASLCVPINILFYPPRPTVAYCSVWFARTAPLLHLAHVIRSHLRTLCFSCACCLPQQRAVQAVLTKFQEHPDAWTRVDSVRRTFQFVPLPTLTLLASSSCKGRQFPKLCGRSFNSHRASTQSIWLSRFSRAASSERPLTRTLPL